MQCHFRTLANQHTPRASTTGRVVLPRAVISHPCCKRAPRCTQRIKPLRVAEGNVRSNAEEFISSVQETLLQEIPCARDAAELREKLVRAEAKVAELNAQVNELYRRAFADVEVEVDAATGKPVSVGASAAPPTAPATQKLSFPSMCEASFGELGRSQPDVMRALLSAKEAQDGGKRWQAFQAEASSLKLRRSRARSEERDLRSLLAGAEREMAKRDGLGLGAAQAEEEEPWPEGEEAWQSVAARGGLVRIVLVTGFESFNVSLYKQAARRIASQHPRVQVSVFSDRDISTRRDAVAVALAQADVFFGSLLFDYDQVEWLRSAIARVPVRLVFESALELMGTTKCGTFQLDPSGKSKGPPPVVKKVLSLFGSGREEDKMVGYLSFLKVGPKLLRFIPGDKARDLRNWLTIYGYWNQGGLANVTAMFQYLADAYFPYAELQQGTGGPRLQVALPPPPQETPATGSLHPAMPGRYFAKPSEYMAWYAQHGPLAGSSAPVVGLLLYRKHVITEQPYIAQLISQLEAEGLLPVPIFINGVEAHTVVRDQLTSSAEAAAIANGTQQRGSLAHDAVKVDAIISTIGFPLVGGPAGTMEGGRQAEVAKAILKSKDVPYTVAAPLLIQDLESWSRDGVAGLQSVVLYSLPELDGAIDTVPLGGLVGDDIYLIPERVHRMASRVRRWVQLRRKPASQRRVAVLLYGFPPGVGATGTAALLNVPRSLESMLRALHEAGYDLGDAAASLATDAALQLDGEALVAALKAMEDQRLVSGGASALMKAGAGPAEQFGVKPAAAEVSAARLKELLSFPPEWGPTEWGPIPFLPDPDVLVQRMEAQWGALRSYRGLMTSTSGGLVVPGLQMGNVWLGVQPLLGIEGDPMRLLFERDLTPHPQYAAAYRWLAEEWSADVVVHFGMHGTVEWLPGSPLGNSGLSWSDVLLGHMPNVYVYAANNPSESVVAKRRGYGTIISHNVPPYGRAGLYKQLSSLKELLAEYREGNPASGMALKGPIIDCLALTGIQEDCPFTQLAEGKDEPDVVTLRAEDANRIDDEAFSSYVSNLWSYLSVLESRLFSEGLHVLGTPPEPPAMAAYLNAYFGDALPAEAVEAISELGDTGLNVARAALERAYAGPAAAAVGEGASARAEAETRLTEALQIRSLLLRNDEELSSMLHALEGGYVLPEAGGDLLRDGAGVLPTGRNIHALDPYRMPSIAALERGTAAGEAILAAHRAANAGAYPETVAVNLWGLDAIKTRGESVALALYLLGAAPVREGTGRIARFELLPLEALGGRPRVDVLCNMSGIFRDSFQNVVELLDDAFQRAAEADEPAELNYVRKHALALRAAGVDNPAARLFSNPAGDYGSMVNERVGASNWDSGRELGDTWAARNAFSYGRGGERGTARPEVLTALLASTDRVVQQIDSVEYGLTDIQEYYANTGALVRAAQDAKRETGGEAASRAVGCSIVEAFGSAGSPPRELEEVLRLEYRSKLVNPRWAQAMAAQGSGGAFEISQRMTALVGWGATVEFTDGWAWDQAAATYALDPQMAAKLRTANPQAFANVLKRCLEAAGRGMWSPSEQVLQQLREMYADMDDELEGVAGSSR